MQGGAQARQIVGRARSPAVVGLLLAFAGVFGDAAEALAASRGGIVQDALPPSACRADVAAAMERATQGALEEAGSLLESARVRCPGDPQLLGELAAVRFQQGRLGEARALAEALVTLDPTHGWGWELLGTLAFLDDDARGALRAWNRAGRPRVAPPTGGEGAIRISGLAASEARALSLEPGDLVTPEELLRARRRLESLPSVSRARVDYRPTPGGGARIEGAVTRHPPHTLSRGALPGHLVRALGGRVELSATGQLGRSEHLRLRGLLDGEYRGGSVAVRLPSLHSSASGDARGDAREAIAAWEGEVLHRVLRPGWNPDLRLERSGARLRVHLWPGARLRASMGVGGDHWPGPESGVGSSTGRHVAMEGRGELGVGEAGLLVVEAEGWTGGFARLQVGVAAHRTLRRTPVSSGGTSVATSGPAPEAGRPRASPGWSLGVEGTLTSLLGNAPLELAPRFGSRRSATHVMRGASSLLPPGRHWGHGSVEVTWLRAGPASLLLGGALFLDGVRTLAREDAQAAMPGGETSSPRHALHGGGGVRLAVPGVEGWLRLDLAVPLEAEPGGRRPHLSVAWVSP